MGLAIAALIVFWLAFSLFRKVIGLILLTAVAGGIWLVLSSPETVGTVMDRAANFIGWD